LPKIRTKKGIEVKKQEFIDRLTDDLELEVGEITDEDSMLKGLFTSLGVLVIIALCDELFSKELKSDKFKSITTVKSLMELIGMEHFED
jgi:acyl carrier protein